MLRKRLRFDDFVPGWRTQRFYRVRNPVHIKTNRSKVSFAFFPAIFVYMKYSDRPASSQGAASRQCSFWLSALSPL